MSNCQFELIMGALFCICESVWEGKSKISFIWTILGSLYFFISVFEDLVKH